MHDTQFLKQETLLSFLTNLFFYSCILAATVNSKKASVLLFHVFTMCSVKCIFSPVIFYYTVLLSLFMSFYIFLTCSLHWWCISQWAISIHSTELLFLFLSEHTLYQVQLNGGVQERTSCSSRRVRSGERFIFLPRTNFSMQCGTGLMTVMLMMLTLPPVPASVQ